RERPHDDVGQIDHPNATQRAVGRFCIHQNVALSALSALQNLPRPPARPIITYGLISGAADGEAAIDFAALISDIAWYFPFVFSSATLRSA
ncbi:MAG: hypothetical protein WBA29_11160, partial [Xanthobacteraceae bacterium]